MKGKNYFFTSRLVCFNETFGCMANASDTAVLWHEAIAGRNADHVASAFHALMCAYSESVKHFIFWTDNCGPQNKNWTLFSSFFNILAEPNGPSSITMKYLEKGHTFMRSDSIHGLIGKKLKREPEVLDFADLEKLIQSVKGDLKIISLTASDFLPFSPFQARGSALPKLKLIRELRFDKGSNLFKYKLDLDSPTYFTRTFTFREISSVPLSENRVRGLNPNKKNEICRVLVPQMPVNKRHFWESLVESSVADLGKTPAS